MTAGLMVTVRKKSAKIKLPEWHKGGQPKTGEASAPAKKEPVGATAD